MKFPIEFIEIIKQLLPSEWEHLLAALEEKPVLSIRKNKAKNSTLDFPDLEKIPWEKEGLYLKDRPNFAHDPLWHSGGYYVQEASSMFVGQFAAPFLENLAQPIVLDMCAAPGGKSTHLLSLLDGKGLLIANEIIPNRNAILRENLVKWGYANYVVTQSESRYLKPMPPLFDLILIDAPCSGEGMFRKDANAIQEWSEKNVANCVERQTEILDNIIQALRPGGMLIYSTCTFEEVENMEQIDRLQTLHDFETVELPINETTWGITKFQKNNSIGYSFYPHKSKGEGFFIAALKKKGESKNQQAIPLKEIPLPLELDNWIKLDSTLTLEIKQEGIQLVPKLFIQNSASIRPYFKIKSVGTSVGITKGKDFIPSPELAFSLHKSDAISTIEVDRETAVRFLKCENIHFKEVAKGWHLVTFQHIGLGWAKVMDNRTNNYFPSNWRLLK